jgi:hypothetical protein
VQEPDPLWHKLVRHEADAGDVAARPIEAGNKTKLDRVSANAKNDRNRRGRCFGRKWHCRAARRGDDGHPAADQIGRQFRQPIDFIVRQAVFDRHVLALNIANFAQALTERSHHGRVPLRRCAIEEPNHRHPRLLLRTHRERPGRSTTAEQRDELAPLHVWMAPAWQEIIWRAAQRSLAVMCPACWCSPGGLLALMESANRVLIIRTGSMSR